ncbi:MAG: hybrid sensor histidine kinase/response regulator [Leptolyngbya sp. DLM2.Bin15]|nr:MAG: hybrid sensor histidine kinase/response regulator [Leptolyngbya sp. DLM2.Bin15]
MSPSDAFQDQNFAYFLTEAQDLLQVIEQELLSIRQERSTAKIHNLMRAAHTLKGAAASMEQRTIREVSHVLEDIFKAFYNPDIEIDAEVESLLFDGYECLRRPVAAALNQQSIDDSDVMNRAAGIIARLQDKFGDAFNPEAALPTSSELGFDMVKSMFEMGVTQRLNLLQTALQQSDPAIAATLTTQADMFLGFAESLNLPGFGAIAQATLDALVAHPDQSMAIATLALQDFTTGKQKVLEGDRTQGGYPSPELQYLAGMDIEHLSDSSPSTVDLDALLMDGLAAEVDPPDREEFPEEDSEFDFDALILDEPIDSDAFSSLATNVDPNPSNPPTPSLSDQAIAPVLENPAPIPLIRPDGSTMPHQPEMMSPSEPSHKRTKISASIRVELNQLESLNHYAGELLINQNRQADQDNYLRLQIQALLDNLRQHRQFLYQIQDWTDHLVIRSSIEEQPIKALSPSRKQSNYLNSPSITSDFDTLELDQYNELHTLVQSTLSNFSRLEHNVETVSQTAKQAQHTTQAQQRLLALVRDDLTDIRMIPIATVLNRLPPVITQLAGSYQKPVRFSLVGADILVDKAIVEKLYDPLLHLVRNAFDHGIEAPQLRRSLQKPDTGHIHIEAYHQGNRTIIEVRDDGGGIDLDSIAQRAVELNLTSPAAIASMDRDRILDFLFQPGFSTRSQVSDLSGRGVGLDIVAAQITAMNGSVTLYSVPGEGTTFVLQIPLSITITKLLVCQVNAIAYAFPVQRIERIILPHPHDFQTTLTGQLAFKFMEQGQECLVPVRHLSNLIAYSANSQQILDHRYKHTQSLSPTPSNRLAQSSPSLHPILVLKVRGDLWALQVDRVLGEQELVIRPLSGIAPPPYIYGGAILSNNDLSFVIDLDVLLKNQPSQTLPALSSDRSPKQLPPSTSTSSHSLIRPSHPRSVQVLLVVDDSITLRQSLTSMLEKQGYRVLQAQDGQDAIDRLQGNPDVSLVLCDIEMPRMNGFEVLSFAGQHPHLSKVPIVMLTSRSSDKHRHLALGLGASAYVTKPYSEVQLIKTIEDTLGQTQR